MNISGTDIPSPTGATAQAPGVPGIDWLALGTGALSLINQQRIAETNLKRAKQGLPPIRLEDVPGATPTVQVGVERGTRDLLFWGGVGAVALIGARMFLKRGRK